MKKIIFGLSCVAIVTICTLNVQNSLKASNELGYSSLTDLMMINSASAEESAPSCSGATCADANDLHYGYFELNGKGTCCGSSATTSGSKQA